MESSGYLSQSKTAIQFLRAEIFEKLKMKYEMDAELIDEAIPDKSVEDRSDVSEKDEDDEEDEDKNGDD